ncbi:DUF3545 family protein [Catenovulum sp. SM1970]|uniref:DUF3545 family protein n=1 Tax=Marinifaba aquimaris TaxID=2741323 RepID=UPI0015734F04|nr:DUF3545 family protein [Marinifaba aquimaris]NTS75469.1 DUF3545 family protein [Marinifaba aquimaris]
MESTNSNNVENTPTRGRPAQKRKWREIEEIKERQRLKKELRELGIYDEFELENMAI